MSDTEQESTGTDTLRLYLVTGLIAALTALLWTTFVSGQSLQEPPVTLSLAALIIAYAATELITVHIEARGEAHALTFSEVPTIVGLLLADPSTVLLARLISGALVLGLVRRQSLHKLLFNLALFMFEATVAATILLTLIGTRNPVAESSWPVIFLALLTATLLSTLAVTLAISVYSGWPGKQMVRQVFSFGLVFCVANTAIGIVLVTAIWEESYAGLLVIGVMLALYLLYRAYMGLTERHKSLETLHHFTRSLGDASEITELQEAVARGARQILRGEHVALLMAPVREGVPATRLVVHNDEVIRANVPAEQMAAALTLLFPRNEARLHNPGEPLPGWLGEIGVKDAAIVPLTTDGEIVGAMVVANRLTDVSSFVEDDLRLLETLANHANVALENGRLVATLQHDAQEKAYQALHDPVTGLPNRTMLHERLESAISDARARDRAMALLFVDLVTFKEVNDTLGTATGDRLLQEVRDRLQAQLPERAQLARFTGDQFAVLVSDVTDPETLVALAEALLADFEVPFTSGDVSLALGANIGIALYPEHAATADLLLQRADAATYRARLEGSGIEVYAAETDPYAPRRLALAADLQEALDADLVDVYVQPKVSLADGMVLGAEALVRWEHPRLGFLSPDQFIPAAEHTGVIRPLTIYVVRNALQQCRAWRDAGHDLHVSVNLSARNLFDRHLVDDIREAIENAGIPPHVLTLELTESTVMGESHQSNAVLEGLQELGVRLSVDDFGTGYSSLTHLRRLPVTELKIDKSFVMTMTVNDQDAVIVRMLVELGRSLGLTTVAEGVESTDAQELLRSYGCEEAQGYLFSRPIPGDQFISWLSRQNVRRIDLGSEVVRFPREPRRAVGESRLS